jgi:hypothetical protein
MRSIIAFSLLGHTMSQFPPQPDYLRSPDPVAAFPTSLQATGPSELTLSNGLISRVFRTTPNFYTTDYRNEGGDGTSFIRGIGPEAQLFFDDASFPLDVGGALGESNYLLWYPDTVTLTSSPLSMSFVNYTVGPILPQWNYVSAGSAPTI